MTHTVHCADSPTATVMVYNGGITLNDTVHGQIAPISGIGDFSILENLHSHLDRIQCRSTVPQDQHCNCRCTSTESAQYNQSRLNPILIARLKVNLLICMAVIASSGMDENAAYVGSMWALGGFPGEGIELGCAVNSSRLASGYRHSPGFVYREASTEAAKTWTKPIQLRSSGIDVYRRDRGRGLGFV